MSLAAMSRTVLATLLLLGFTTPWLAARGDVLELKNGGRLEGKVTPPTDEQSPYVIELELGGQVTLDHRQVHRVYYDVPAKRQYAEQALKHADTSTDQWRLARWCEDHGLELEFLRHCQRVVELDTNHQEARKGLGHHFMDGGWTSRAGHMSGQGYIRHEGRWMTQQQAALLIASDRRHEEQVDWKMRLNRWRVQLGTVRPGKEEVDFAEIRDPKAVPAIVVLLGNETRPDLIRMYIDTLGNIGSPSATSFLLKHSIFQNNVIFRERCLQHVIRHRQPEMVDQVAEYLQHYDNALINRAAIALAKLDYPSAIVPLSSALATQHPDFKPRPPNYRKTSEAVIRSTYFFSQRLPPDRFVVDIPRASFQKMTMAQLQTKSKNLYFAQWVENHDVYAAMRSLSDGEDFGFNGDSWRFWYQAQQRAMNAQIPDIRLSRDD
ncbi:MAG: HEAT repeat domain-containing protein [Pirellulaceae bacterium]